MIGRIYLTWLGSGIDTRGYRAVIVRAIFSECFICKFLFNQRQFYLMLFPVLPDTPQRLCATNKWSATINSVLGGDKLVPKRQKIIPISIVVTRVILIVRKTSGRT